VKTERLLFQINPPDFVKDFIQADGETWNPWLQRQPGFFNKTSRILPGGAVEILIHWASLADAQRASKKQEEMKHVDYMLRSRSPARYTLVQSSFI
jgi:hypothetical protein